ncbi:MAG: hypothetical protein WCI63_02285 [bacterium]
MIMKINRASLMAVGSGAAVIMLLVFSGFFLGKYLRPSNVVANKDNLYLANQVTLTANGPKATDKAVFIKLRYKPSNASKWTETTTKSAIATEEKATYQTFDINNLKKATTYEYQTQTIDSSGKGENWSDSASFATARILGTSENDSAVAFTKANNLENAGDITFEGKAENANFYVWDFGDGQKSESLVDTANTNHIYSVGGDVTATMTAYRTVSESDSILNKQKEYSGKAIVAQKKVKFFVNLPVVRFAYDEKGDVRVESDEITQKTPSSEVALLDQTQAVLGATEDACNNWTQVYSTSIGSWPTQLKVREVGVYQLKNMGVSSGYKKVIDDNLINAGCRVRFNEEKTAFSLRCPKATYGNFGVSFEKKVNGEWITCGKKTVNVQVAGGGEKCDNPAWVLQNGVCKFINNSCATKIDNCKCGIQNVTAKQVESTPPTPLTYTFKITPPADSNAKLYKIDFNDGDSAPQVITDINNTIYTFKNPGPHNVTVTSFAEENPSTDSTPCGTYTLTLNPQSCSVGQIRTFTADKYSGDMVQSPTGVPIQFYEPTVADADLPKKADKYRIKYGDNSEEVVSPSTSTTDGPKVIATHTYLSRGNYLPTIEGLKQGGTDSAPTYTSCGSPINLNKQIVITGPVTGTEASCSLGTTTLTATPPEGVATPQDPLEVTFTTKIVKADNIPLGTEYQLVWGDAAGASEPIIVEENATEKTITKSHKYKGPNLSPGSDGKYTVILQAFRIVGGARVSCGSVSTAVTITNIADEGVSCAFTGGFTAKPMKVDVSKNKTVTFKQDITPEESTKTRKQPNFWRYSFGDGDTKPINATVEELNKMKIMHDYDTNGTYNVVLRGYYYGNSSVECAGVAGLDNPIEVVNGKENPNKPGSCTVGDVQLTPAGGSVTKPFEKTVTITGMDRVDSVVIDWGLEETPTTIENLKDKPTTTSKHIYKADGTYPVKVTSYKNNLAVNCGTKEFEAFTIGTPVPGTGTEPTCNLTASPETLTASGSSTINWTTTNATSFKINEADKTPVASGSMTETVAATKTYTGTATKDSKTATCTATVTVGTTPAATTFTITTLTANDRKCQITVPGRTPTTDDTIVRTYPVNQGESLTFTGSATENSLTFNGFLVDGALQTGTSYTLSNITAAHTLQANCLPVTQNPVKGACFKDPGGLSGGTWTQKYFNDNWPMGACSAGGDPIRGDDTDKNGVKKWHWTCPGTYGGDDVFCSATKK